MCASGVPPIWHDVVATHLRMRSTSVLERGPARVITSGAKQWRRPTPDAGLHHGCVPRHDESGRAQDLLTRPRRRSTHGSRRRPERAPSWSITFTGVGKPARACRGKTGAGSTTGGRRSARCRPTEGDHAPRFDGFHPWQPAWPSGCDRGRPIGGLPTPESTTEMRIATAPSSRAPLPLKVGARAIRGAATPASRRGCRNTTRRPIAGRSAHSRNAHSMPQARPASRSGRRRCRPCRTRSRRTGRRSCRRGPAGTPPGRRRRSPERPRPWSADQHRQDVGPEQADERQRQAQRQARPGSRSTGSACGRSDRRSGRRSVPTATAPKNRNRWIWALPTETPNRSIMKKV